MTLYAFRGLRLGYDGAGGGTFCTEDGSALSALTHGANLACAGGNLLCGVRHSPVSTLKFIKSPNRESLAEPQTITFVVEFQQAQEA